MSATPNLAELPPQLEAAIGHIRAALQPSADAATKEAAAMSCRVLLSVLEARPGQPLNVAAPAAAGTATPAATPPVPPSPSSDAPIDRFLARFVEKFGKDLGEPDASVPYVGARHTQVGSLLFAHLAQLGGVR